MRARFVGAENLLGGASDAVVGVGRNLCVKGGHTLEMGIGAQGVDKSVEKRSLESVHPWHGDLQGSEENWGLRDPKGCFLCPSGHSNGTQAFGSSLASDHKPCSPS